MKKDHKYVPSIELHMVAFEGLKQNVLEEKTIQKKSAMHASTTVL
jgi:hypothetical protein